MKNLLILGCAVCLLTACAGESSPRVAAMQRKDKQLSCKEALLEMNEADFYRKAAEKNRNPNLKNVLMPLGYISTYMDAEEAIGAANARMDYLDKIYEIMGCDAKPNNGGADYVAAPMAMQGGNYENASMGYTPIRGRLESNY